MTVDLFDMMVVSATVDQWMQWALAISRRPNDGFSLDIGQAVFTHRGRGPLTIRVTPSQLAMLREAGYRP